jgi:hypothetical protein
VLTQVDLHSISEADERIVRRAFTLAPGGGAAVVATRRARSRRFTRKTQKPSFDKPIPL